MPFPEKSDPCRVRPNRFFDQPHRDQEKEVDPREATLRRNATGPEAVAELMDSQASHYDIRE